MSPFSHHGLPVGGKEWMQQGGHRERNATRGMGLENERSCDMGVHLRRRLHRHVMRIALSFTFIFCDERVLW